MCQEDKDEDLKSTHTNPTKREADGHTNIATNIPLFHSINALPTALHPPTQSWKWLTRVLNAVEAKKSFISLKPSLLFM